MKFYIEYQETTKENVVRAGINPLSEIEREFGMDIRGSVSTIAELRPGGPYYAEITEGEIGQSYATDQNYLDSHCAEVSEEDARRYHPELFVYLANSNMLKV